MATEIYKIQYVYTVDGKEIEIIPLKIKYMKELMSAFEALKNVKKESQSLLILCECVRIAMKQYCPIIETIEDVEDNFDIHTIHEILDFSAGIKLNKVVEQEAGVEDNEDAKTWTDLDLAKLESEVFLLGIWKSYEELETSISLQELMAILTATRELDYEEKKFMAALQGVNLDEKNDGSGEVKGQKEWEDMKARVFSKGATSDSNDILALQGVNAQKVGFGIGMGLDYEDDRK